MTKKVFLTIPALLAGPVLVILVSLTIYDFTVIGGTATMAIVSFGVVRRVWADEGNQSEAGETESHQEAGP